MNDIHQSISSSKIIPIPQRSSFGGADSVSMVKLERGLVQRSLLYCFENGYFSFIRYLLQSGAADARERDNKGRTGLMYCCFIDHDGWAQNIAMTLLEYDAQIEDQDNRGLNALHYAIITQRSVLIRRYLSSLDFALDRTIDIYGNTFLHYACSTGNVDVLGLIIKAMNRYSIDLNIKNNFGLTAYDIACQLNHQRCRNLLRNELQLHRDHHLSSTNSTDSHTVVASLANRRFSISNRTRPGTSSTYQRKSILSFPLSVSNSKNFRLRYPSTSASTNEKLVYPPPIFINPIEARHMILKRNENLDESLTNQAKSRSDFAPASLTSQSAVFTSSSSTWRDDFSKVFNQLQTFKTPSYRKTVHPPVSNELSCESFERLYGVGSVNEHDCSHHQPLLSLSMQFSQNIIHQRRSSTTSIKSLHKTKK